MAWADVEVKGRSGEVSERDRCREKGEKRTDAKEGGRGRGVKVREKGTCDGEKRCRRAEKGKEAWR